MKTNVTISVENIFSSIFATISTESELRETANSIAKMLKESFAERAKELKLTPAKTQADEPAKAAKATPATKAQKAKEVAKALKQKGKEKLQPTQPEPKAESKATTKAKAKAKKSASDDTIIDISDKKAIKALNLTFEKYNETSWVLYGDTKPLRIALRQQFNGIYCDHLRIGEGWCFRNKRAQEVADALGIKVKIS